MEITPTGDLQVQTLFGPIYEKKPVIYQETNEGQQYVAGSYEMRGSDIFGFAIDNIYDSSCTLVIDPGLAYSTFLGGTQYETGLAIAS